MTKRPLVIYDCNIFWRALFSPLGLGHKCIQLIADATVLHFTSDETLKEIEDVLTRPETFKKFPTIGAEEIETFIASIVLRSTHISKAPSAFKLPRDPKDEPYIDLAAAVEADFLVTTDKDMLDLMSATEI